MTDIYQAIWNADQESNGVPAVVEGEATPPDAVGYAVVSNAIASSRDPQLRVLPKVVIPEEKSTTYTLAKKLFDNYALLEEDEEADTPGERLERHEFVEAVRDTPPMRIARAYIAERTSAISDERWHSLLIDNWFRTFHQGGDPHLSGFEHVIVGEGQAGKVQGYHFWYKYWLDDGFARQYSGDLPPIPGLRDDRIRYSRAESHPEQAAFPESVTIEFEWNAPDYANNTVRTLFKDIGGFFVGCSVEGLMALGTVRAHVGARAPKDAVINGAGYTLKVFRSDNQRHIRTFYPMFNGAVDPVTGEDQPMRPPPLTPRPVSPGGPGDVRILCAFVNPAGHDVGKETVSIVNAGSAAVALTGWKLVDKNGRTTALGDVTIMPGEVFTEKLTGDGVQLGNRGSTLQLQDPGGTVVHNVSYSKAQAKRENGVLIFQEG